MPPEDAPSPPRRHRALRWLRELLLTLLLGALLFHLGGWLRAPELPNEAPDFILADLDGGTVQLSQLRGKTVVLNFWATWCGPCRVEIPSFSTFAEDHPELVVLGIATDGSPGQLKAARKKLDIRYPVLVGDRATVQAYDVESLPTTVIIDPEGKVRSAHGGMLTRPQLWWMTR